MTGARRILIVGGGTAGWLTAAYLARALADGPGGRVAVTLLESPEIGTVGVGEGAFPTLRETLKFLGVPEARFVRATGATFKQGIRFLDWGHTPDANGRRHSYDHPFEAPLPGAGGGLAPWWLLQDPRTRAPFAQAVSIQSHVADAGRGPKDGTERDYDGPLSYAYHFDAAKLIALLAERASELGVRHLADEVTRVDVGPEGRIERVHTSGHGALEADLFVDCSGFRAELIGAALAEPFRSVRRHLFTDRALATRLPYPTGGRLPSYTLATAHEAGWVWDIGLADARGVGFVYSSDHLSDDRAGMLLHRYADAALGEITVRPLRFEPGWRERQWVGNCVAVGLAAGFLEPLEATGLVMVEAAAAMIAELFPHAGPVDAPARRFSQLMRERFESIVAFLKLHYCLSRRTEPFWRDNADPATWPERLRELLDQWRFRPPGRYDLAAEADPFAPFNYQYVLYGMGFSTDLAPGRNDLAHADDAARQFARVQAFGARAAQELPPHRELVEELRRGG